MSYARGKKHYRAAKKQAGQQCANGVFISNKSKPKLALIAGSFAFGIFIIGLLMGLLIGRD